MLPKRSFEEVTQLSLSVHGGGGGGGGGESVKYPTIADPCIWP